MKTIGKRIGMYLLMVILLIGVMPSNIRAEEVSSDTTTDSSVEDENASQEETPQKEWVIVLDPGHGGSDSGASRYINGGNFVERDLVLKIAQYCKEELEKNENVTVYLTRSDNSSANQSRRQRAYYAASLGADAFISFHLNATYANSTYSVSGAEGYYQNQNYGKDLSDAGLIMSNSILTELSGLGLSSNGSIIWNADDGSVYPDGTMADYLGINYWSKLYGIPGVLIEHAYINNPNDVANYLTYEESLKQLGIADAHGIMNALNNENYKFEKRVCGTWRYNGRWWFEYPNGEWPANEWKFIYGHWYWFDKDGYMTTGWQYVDNKWYYLGGASDGSMKTGWQYINNRWYYFTQSGDMTSGWQYIGGKWYYLGLPQDGSMKTGWQFVDGTWYYMYANGDMAHDTWIGRYYVNSWGAWTATR